MLGTIISGLQLASDVYQEAKRFTADPYGAGQTGVPLPPSNGMTKRHRRKRLLTCQDKSDIAFLHGQLGSGALGKAAISSLLARRC